MRDFDYAVTPAKLLTPEMVQMIGKIHEHKGRQDILMNFYKEDDRLPEDIAAGKDPDYQSVYRLICSNYQSIAPTPQEFLQIHRKLTASRVPASRQRYEEPEEDGTFDLHALLKNRGTSSRFAEERAADTGASGVPGAAGNAAARVFSSNTAEESAVPEDMDEDLSDYPGFRKTSDRYPEYAHMRSAQMQRSGFRFRETLQRARNSGIERVSMAMDTDPEEAIENLCDEFLLAWEEDRIDKLILIPMFITDLNCIRPFDSGNEAFCQLIALLLLLRAGYMVGKYVSLDSLIGKSRLTYNNVLQASSEGWEEERNNYSVFAAYFLGIVSQAYDEFESLQKVPGEKKQKKPDRIRELIDARNTKITKKEIMEMFPDISKVTVERALTDMVKKGYIVKVGAGPSTAYVKVAEQ